MTDVDYSIAKKMKVYENCKLIEEATGNLEYIDEAEIDLSCLNRTYQKIIFLVKLKRDNEQLITDEKNGE